jgi:hypothetical protein
VVGQSVSYTATVSSIGLGNPTPPGGTVLFTDNDAPIAGCGAVPLSGGSASCRTTPDTTGAHNIVAEYFGTGAFDPSESPIQSLTEMVTRIPCNALAGCNLSGLKLFDASLAGTDLEGANLNGANLIGANLSGANLQGANLNRADLQGVNLNGANVTITTNFTGVTWNATTCPDGTNTSYNFGGTCLGHLQLSI